MSVVSKSFSVDEQDRWVSCQHDLFSIDPQVHDVCGTKKKLQFHDDGKVTDAKGTFVRQWSLSVNSIRYGRPKDDLITLDIKKIDSINEFFDVKKRYEAVVVSHNKAAKASEDYKIFMKDCFEKKIIPINREPKTLGELQELTYEIIDIEMSNYHGELTYGTKTVNVSDFEQGSIICKKSGKTFKNLETIMWRNWANQTAQQNLFYFSLIRTIIKNLKTTHPELRNHNVNVDTLPSVYSEKSHNFNERPHAVYSTTIEDTVYRHHIWINDSENSYKRINVTLSEITQKTTESVNLNY
jgi:hypothetical protein